MSIMKSCHTHPRLIHHPDAYKHHVHQVKFEINALVAQSGKCGTYNDQEGELQQFSTKKMWYL